MECHDAVSGSLVGRSFLAGEAAKSVDGRVLTGVDNPATSPGQIGGFLFAGRKVDLGQARHNAATEFLWKGREHFAASISRFDMGDGHSQQSAHDAADDGGQGISENEHRRWAVLHQFPTQFPTLAEEVTEDSTNPTDGVPCRGNIVRERGIGH